MTNQEIKDRAPYNATHWNGVRYICRTMSKCYLLSRNGDVECQIKFSDSFISLNSYTNDIYGYQEDCKGDYADYY